MIPQSLAFLANIVVPPSGRATSFHGYRKSVAIGLLVFALCQFAAYRIVISHASTDNLTELLNSRHPITGFIC
ncbi:MAG: hypothetical protein KDA89_04855, partial [Planctomycetaceae bacterium]|nr:hypothetical protein [Planctomycetaceae bacterium]